MSNQKMIKTIITWWLTALTICLPITITLLFFKNLRSRWFAWFYVNMIGELHVRGTAAARKRAFQLLNDHLPKKSPDSPLQVLEIGAGEALNLQHYPDGCDVTFLDASDYFYSYLMVNIGKFPEKVRSWRRVKQCAEDMKAVASESQDIVISTYLHCSCSDNQAVLREVKRVLKPGGKYLFVDHVGYPKNEFGYIAQKLLYPLWYLYFDGCHTHKDVESEVRKSPFSDIICEQFVLPDGFMLKYQFLGIATK